MSFSIRKYLAAAIVPLMLGAIGCNTQSVGAAGGTPDNTEPGGTGPAISAPIKYSRFEAKNEERLKRETNYGCLIAKTVPGFKTALFEKYGLEAVSKFSANGAEYHRLYKVGDVMGALRAIRKINGVVYAEPERQVQHFSMGNGISISPDAKLRRIP
jgi:hypothetical protein